MNGILAVNRLIQKAPGADPEILKLGGALCRPHFWFQMV